MMKATLPRVGCIGLLDRPLIAPFSAGLSFLSCTTRCSILLFSRSVSNARHHLPGGNYE